VHCVAYDLRTRANCCWQNVRGTSAHLSLTNKVSKLLTLVAAAAATTNNNNKKIYIKKRLNRIKEAEEGVKERKVVAVVGKVNNRQETRRVCEQRGTEKQYYDESKCNPVEDVVDVIMDGSFKPNT